MTVPTEILYMSFPISIPATATLDGIVLRVEGYGGAAATGPVWDGYASINSGTSFTNGAGSLIPITAQTFPSDAIDSVGGSTNTWGGLTTTDVNSAGFRIGVLAGDAVGGILDTYFIDHVTCEVFYTRATYTSTGGFLSDWSAGATWDSGLKPEATENVVISSGNPVYVETLPEACSGLVVDSGLWISTGGAVWAYGSDSSVVVGASIPSYIENDEPAGFGTGTADLDLGVGASGIYLGSNGSSASIAGDTNVGAGSFGGMYLDVSASFDTSGDLNVGVASDGLLEIAPIASGAAGIGGFECDNVTLGANSALRIFTGNYVLSDGDSWEIIAYNGTLTGAFDEIDIYGPGSEGFGIEVSSAEAGIITATVVFTGEGLPSTTNWGLIVLLTSLSLVGAVVLNRMRKSLHA
jgi:hypothetical protein